MTKLDLSHIQPQLESQSFFNQLTEAFLEFTMVTITDVKGRMIFVNKRFCEISGFTDEELVGHSHRIVNSGYHPKSFFAELWGQISRGQLWNGEVKNKRKDGTYYWVHTSIFPMKNEQGEVVSFASLSTDISEAKEARSNYIQAAKLSSIGEATAQIAHDLNNPVSVIFGMTEILMKQPELSDKSKEILNSISLSSGRMLRLISQLKLQARNAHEDAKLPYSVEDLVLNSVVLLEYNLKKGQIKMDLQLDEGKCKILANVGQIESIFQNLLTNAIDAFNVPHLGVQIQNPKVIQIRVRRNQDRVEVDFEDNAGGMPEAVQKQMFEAFYTTKPAGKGTGLGLAIVENIVHDHNGSVSVRSQMGKGTVFTLQFPIVG